jgi:hypothetical protein
MATKPSRNNDLLRFSIKPVGQARSEDQIRQDVRDALEEALQDYKTATKRTLRAEAEPEGAFTGVELAAFWLLKTFAGGVIGGAGGALYKYLAKALRKRNLDPGKPTVVKQKLAAKRGKKRS